MKKNIKENKANNFSSEISKSVEPSHINFWKKNACCGACKGSGPCYETKSKLQVSKSLTK